MNIIDNNKPTRIKRQFELSPFVGLSKGQSVHSQVFLRYCIKCIREQL